MLLASSSEPVHMVTNQGLTVLHIASLVPRSQYFARLLELIPDAVRAVNSESKTPFDVATAHNLDFAIELMKWKLTLDEIVSAFTAFEARAIPLPRRTRRKKQGCDERWKPVVERQCARLAELLNQDMAGIVFEYVGLDPRNWSNERPS